MVKFGFRLLEVCDEPFRKGVIASRMVGNVVGCDPSCFV